MSKLGVRRQSFAIDAIGTEVVAVFECVLKHVSYSYVHLIVYVRCMYLYGHRVCKSYLVEYLEPESLHTWPISKCQTLPSEPTF